MSQTFSVMETNPNILSNGCLCNEGGDVDCKGPFLVWNTTEMESNIAPFPVLCAPCAKRAGVLVAEAEITQYGQEPKLAKRPTSAKRSIDEGDGPTI